MIINIDEITQNAINIQATQAENSNTIARRIITKIVQEQIRLNDDNAIIGQELEMYLYNSGNYSYVTEIFGEQTMNIEYIGALFNLKIYKDSLYEIKPNEVIFFNELDELPIYIQRLRLKKLNRITSYSNVLHR